MCNLKKIREVYQGLSKAEILRNFEGKAVFCLEFASSTNALVHTDSKDASLRKAILTKGVSFH